MTVQPEDKVLSSAEILEAMLRAATATGPAARASLNMLLAAQLDLVAVFEAGDIKLTEHPDGLHGTVTDWVDVLYRLKTGPTENMVRIAKSFAEGGDVVKWLRGMDARQVRAFINAILVCSGMTEWFQVTTTDVAPDYLRIAQERPTR